MIITHRQTFKQNNWYKTYASICVVMLATSPAILHGEGNRNLGLIGLMCIAPLFSLFLISRRKYFVEELLVIIFSFLVVFFPAILHSETRWSTVFYSLMFCSLFLSFSTIIKGKDFHFLSFLSLLRYLIYAYAFVLLIQQFCVLFGLSIFNVSNYDPNNPWKLNSLSSEPSHTARIVGLLMFTYLCGCRIYENFGGSIKNSRKQLPLVWISFLWTMLTIASSTSIIMIVIVVLGYVRKISLRSLLFFCLTLLFVILILPLDLVERVLSVVRATLTLDYNKILEADHSGGIRIAPLLILIEKAEIFSLPGLIGNGVDSVSFFMSDYIWGVKEGLTGGGLMLVWYEYGFITFLSFLIFSLIVTHATKKPANFLIWFIMVFMGGVNSQLVWLTIFLLYTLKVAEKQAMMFKSNEVNVIYNQEYKN